MALKQEIQNIKIENEDSRFLIEELQKKNLELVSKNRRLNEQMTFELQSQNLKFAKYKAETEQQISELRKNLEEKQVHL